MIWQRECFDLISSERSLQGNSRDRLGASNLECKAEGQPDFPLPLPHVPYVLLEVRGFSRRN